MFKNDRGREDFGAKITPEGTNHQVIDQDYSAYLENEHLNQNSLLEGPNPQRKPELQKLKKKAKFNIQNNDISKLAPKKYGAEMAQRNESRNSEYRESNNSNINEYSRDNGKSFEISDLSEDYHRPRKPQMAVEEERRAQTHFDHHPSPNDAPMFKNKRKFRQDGFRNLKGNKISAKIKERRKSDYEIELADHNGMYDLQKNMDEVDQYSRYQTEDMYHIPTSYTPDLREDYEEVKTYDPHYLKHSVHAQDYYDSNSDDLCDQSLRPESMYPLSESGSSLHPQEIAESEEDEYYAVKYAREYIHKIDEDMREVHNRNALLVNEMQENFKQYDKEINSLNQWKQNAVIKIKNYKLAI